MKKVVLFSILFFNLLFSYAQFKNVITEIFDEKLSNINYTGITQNIFIDRGLNTSGYFLNNSMVDSCNSSKFLLAFSDIYFSQVNESQFLLFDADSLKRRIDSLIDIPIGLINVKFSRLDSNAFLSGRLYYSNNVLYEDSLIGTSSFSSDSIILISPLKNLIYGDSIYFCLNNDFIFSNSQNSIIGFQVNFDDGLGWRIGNLSGDRFLVRYNNEGLKTIMFRIQLANDSIVYKSSPVNFKFVPISPFASFTNYPIEDQVLIAQMPFVGYFLDEVDNSIVDHSLSEGKAYVRYYFANQDRVLRKPIIISDAFDPGNYRRFEVDYNRDDMCYEKGGLLGRFFYPNGSGTVNIVDILHNLGYDIILVDYAIGADYIEQNGRAFVSVLNECNKRLKNAGSNNQIIVVGPSMGGQVTKYALSYIEKFPEERTNWGIHNVRLWVSFDSPHQGANITYGAQHIIRGEKVNEPTYDYRLKLKCPAAMQQLRYHLENKSHFFTAYSNTMDYLGYPNNLRKIAITNGKLDGTADGSAGLKAVEATFWGIPIVQIFYSPSYYNYGLVSKLKSDEKYLTEQENNFCIDASPGGTYDIFSQLYIAFKKIQPNIPMQLFRYSSCFMPTKSTLDCSGNKNYLERLDNICLVQQNRTPFDSYWGPNHVNMEHVTFNENLFNYLLNEFETYIFGEREINSVCDEKEIVLHLPYPVTNPNITWYCSDNLEIIPTNNPKIIKIKSISLGEGWVSADVSSLTRSYSLAKYPITVSHANNTPFPVIYDQTLSQTTTTWNTSYTLPQPITIESGKTLTISSTVYCAPNAKIIVKPGGKLVLDGGTLTNYCSNKPWQGIVVEGNSTLSQMGTTPNQGVVIVKNNAIIENAICGIKVGDTQDPSKNGGIVYASETQFKNCKNAVLFAPYKNINNSVELANRSKFTDCEFIVDNNFYSTGMFFDAHAKLFGVHGITFTGCRFSNAQTSTYPSAKRYASSGIASFNSGFTVKPKCFSNLIPGEVCDISNVEIESSFTGLDYGIVAQGSDGFFKISVLSTNFESNDCGIYLSEVYNAKILKNSFVVGKNNSNVISNPVGVYILGSPGFRVEENVFNNNSYSSLDKIGLTIKRNGLDNNVVYKNQFNNLNTAQKFIGGNFWFAIPENGLKSICNDHFNSNNFDIFVESDPNTRVNGINMYQNMIYNYNGIDQVVGAGNKFSNFQYVNMQYNNEGNFLFYYFNPNNPDECLTNYSSSTISPKIAPENPCPSKINGLYPSIINAELTSVTLKYANLKYNYNQLIDAGNTPELIKLIQDVWSEDVWNLRNQLISKSPYLSQEAILSVAEENLLPPALLLEICIANPDATKDEGFLEKLRCCISTPLPEYMINLIKASWENKTLRTDMEEQLSAFKTHKNELFYYLTEIMLSDTIYDYSNIINHLGTRGSYSDYLSMAEIAINQDDFDQANLYLDILENNSEKLSEEEALEIASFRDYIAIRESLFLDSTTIYQLDSTQIASLETYASSNNYRGAILARNILCFLYDICIDDVQAPPKMLHIGSNGNNSQNTTPFIAYVKVMPNPAHEYASFIWDMKSFDKNAILYIYDQNGKILVTQPIDTKQGQWVWNIKNITNGVYVYTLKSDQLILYSGKIIVNK